MHISLCIKLDIAALDHVLIYKRIHELDANSAKYLVTQHLGVVIHSLLDGV